ncbi:MAG: hypothetical protein ACREQ5_11585, partial [Candidatus Dormibacteria bacterium]
MSDLLQRDIADKWREENVPEYLDAKRTLRLIMGGDPVNRPRTSNGRFRKNSTNPRVENRYRIRLTGDLGERFRRAVKLANTTPQSFLVKLVYLAMPIWEKHTSEFAAAAEATKTIAPDPMKLSTERWHRLVKDDVERQAISDNKEKLKKMDTTEKMLLKLGIKCT